MNRVRGYLPIRRTCIITCTLSRLGTMPSVAATCTTFTIDVSRYLTLPPLPPLLPGICSNSPIRPRPPRLLPETFHLLALTAVSYPYKQMDFIFSYISTFNEYGSSIRSTNSFEATSQEHGYRRIVVNQDYIYF